MMPTAVRTASANVGTTCRTVPSALETKRSATPATSTHRSQLTPGFASQMTAVVNAAMSAALVQSLTSSTRRVGDASASANGAVVMCILSEWLDRGRQRAEATLPPVKVNECALEICRVEIGPALVGEVELRVRAFPQQKIAEAALAAGANQQIDIRTEPTWVVG